MTEYVQVALIFGVVGLCAIVPALLWIAQSLDDIAKSLKQNLQESSAMLTPLEFGRLPSSSPGAPARWTRSTGLSILLPVTT